MLLAGMPPDLPGLRTDYSYHTARPERIGTGWTDLVDRLSGSSRKPKHGRVSILHRPGMMVGQWSMNRVDQRSPMLKQMVGNRLAGTLTTTSFAGISVSAAPPLSVSGAIVQPDSRISVASSNCAARHSPRANAQIFRDSPPRPAAVQRQPLCFTPKFRRRPVFASHRTPPRSRLGARRLLRQVHFGPGKNPRARMD